VRPDREREELAGCWLHDGTASIVSLDEMEGALMGYVIDFSKLTQARLARALAKILDEDGKIIPEKRDLDQVEREYPGKTPAEKWRLAQANRLLIAYGETPREGPREGKRRG
jgi:hypothetical protein